MGRGLNISFAPTRSKVRRTRACGRGPIAFPPSPMEISRWLTIIALTLFLAEGFALTVFPRQFKAMLVESDPGALQMLGLIETVIAAALITGILFG